MANYKITSLNTVLSANGQAIYKDIHLDFSLGYSKNNVYFKSNEINDLKADTDYGAVRNSIFNLFNTDQGERILNPDYGLSLKSYLFESVTKENGLMVGDLIKACITKYEPRVTIQRINIIANEDENLYEITLIVTIAALQNAPVSITAALSNSGFRYV